MAKRNRKSQKMRKNQRKRGTRRRIRGGGLVKVEPGPWLSRAGRDTTPIFFMAEVSRHTDNTKVQVIGSDLTIYPLKESVSDIPLPATYDITTTKGEEYKYAYAKLTRDGELSISYAGGPSMGKVSLTIPFSDISTMTVPQQTHLKTPLDSY